MNNDNPEKNVSPEQEEETEEIKETEEVTEPKEADTVEENEESETDAGTDGASEGAPAKSGSRVSFAISIVFFVLLLALCIFYLTRYTSCFGGGNPFGAKDVEDWAASQGKGDEGVDSPELDLPENPVDFDKQRDINNEIYAWIYIPNTKVNYPILQSTVDDLFYLERGLDKNYYAPGVLFTQTHNRRDFDDPVTVIYGHVMAIDSSMFGTLHYFEDKKFFDENEYFYIYTPGRILTYRIVSAYKYDDRHILNSFDFSDREVVKEYFDFVTDPASMVRNVREGVTLTPDDKLVVLSTCMDGTASKFRYLVNGVLIKTEFTK